MMRINAKTASKVMGNIYYHFLGNHPPLQDQSGKNISTCNLHVSYTFFP